jgi:hypothetical protein
MTATGPALTAPIRLTTSCPSGKSQSRQGSTTRPGVHQIFAGVSGSGDGPLSVRGRSSTVTGHPKILSDRFADSIFRTRALSVGASARPPVRNQGPGGSTPGPDAGHPLHGARGNGASCRARRKGRAGCVRSTGESQEICPEDHRVPPELQLALPPTIPEQPPCAAVNDANGTTILWLCAVVRDAFSEAPR